MAVSNVDFCNCAYEGKLQDVKTAVELDEAILSKTDSNKRTGMHWACSSGRTDVVNFLISKGAQVVIY